MSPDGPAFVMVDACVRDGRGGSPTAVVWDDEGITLAERVAVPRRARSSHAVFIGPTRGGSPPHLRFFTSAGELPACGHGTVAGLAVLADAAGGRDDEVRAETAAQHITGHVTRQAGSFDVTYDPGEVQVRRASIGEAAPILDALGLEAPTGSGRCEIATLGRARLLVPVESLATLRALQPDHGRLRELCDQQGLLGCYVHAPPGPGGHRAARMFAPSIGVDEDVANANSTAGLAVSLGQTRPVHIAVDMGDSLGLPATVTATAAPADGVTVVGVGGAAIIRR